MEKVILHCDLNNFYASVECLLNPEYSNVPLAVSGNADKRHGIILAKNELAKAKGIQTGEVIWSAKQKEPALILVPPHFSEYTRFSNMAFDVYSTFTSQVEPFGADECYLDCTNSVKKFGSGEIIADKIRQAIKDNLGLTISAGVSFNKVFAKLASDIKKPDATTVISKDNFRQVAWTLPASDLLMVGSSTMAKLKKLNIHTIGDLAIAQDKILREQFGINGTKLKIYASGNDTEPVREYVKHHQNESYGHGMTTTKDITTANELKTLIYYLAEKIALRLKHNSVRGYGVAVSLRSSELENCSKQAKLPSPIMSTNDITANAFKLASNLWDNKTKIRTVTVSIFSLTNANAPTQISMFDADCNIKTNENLDNALMNIRAKHGSEAIVRANLILTDFIYDKNDDEDFLPFKR